MKKNLHRTLFVSCLLASTISPDETQAQCTCSDGLPATPQTHYVVLDTTNAPSSTITFPQFNPTIGILSCVEFKDTTSLVVTFTGKNTAPVAVVYRWSLNVNNFITGPGVNVSQNSVRTYGPDSLWEKDNHPGDTVTHGPETIFEDKFNRTNSSSVASYIGLGNVNFNYAAVGGAFATQGSMDYVYTVRSRYWGKFRLTYFWCPNLVLATNIKNFFAVKSNKKVDISWISENEQSSNIYEIQISQNGKDFRSVGSKKAEPLAQGVAAKYAYQYNPDHVTSGKLYFRIKQTDANGKISYTTVQSINIDSDIPGGFTMYPNPAVNRISLQFDGNLNGAYRIDITNQLGQAVHSQLAKFRNQSKTDLQVAGNIAPGVYYVRVKDESNTQVYTNKIMIQR